MSKVFCDVLLCRMCVYTKYLDGACSSMSQCLESLGEGQC